MESLSVFFGDKTTVQNRGKDLSGRKLFRGWSLSEGNANGYRGNHDVFTVEPVFKIDSLNMFSTKPMIRYHEILKFRRLSQCFYIDDRKL